MASGPRRPPRRCRSISPSAWPPPGRVLMPMTKPSRLRRSSMPPRPRSKEADLQRERLVRVERYRRDPLGFVIWAFPWGEPGPLKDHAGLEQWQADVLRGIGRRLAAG